MRQWITFGLVATITMGIAGFASAAPGDKGKGKGKGEGKGGSPEARFKALDTNGDGKISLEEFKGRAKDASKAEGFFKRLDKNSDGFIDADEFKAMPAGKGKGGERKGEKKGEK